MINTIPKGSKGHRARAIFNDQILGMALIMPPAKLITMSLRIDQKMAAVWIVCFRGNPISRKETCALAHTSKQIVDMPLGAPCGGVLQYPVEGLQHIE